MGAVSELCNKCVVLKNGEINFIGEASEAINHYLSFSRDLAIKKINKFEIDNTTPIQVEELFIADSNGNLISEIELGEDVTLFIKYVVLQDVTDSVMAFMLTKDGMPVLYSYDTDLNVPLRQYRKAGRYFAKVKLPTSIIKEGMCEIKVMIGVGQDNISKSNVSIGFDIVNNRVDTMHYSYKKDRPGFLYKAVPWEIVNSDSNITDTVTDKAVKS